MSEVSTLAALATAGGTLVLAIATFSATRSSNRSARVAERALQIGVRPVLFNARPQDPPQKVGFIDDHWVVLRDGLVAVQEHDDSHNVYLSIPLRNVGSGIAVLHGWHLWPERANSEVHPPPADEFRQHGRDLYVPAGDVGFWQAALRDGSDPLYERALRSIRERTSMSVDVLYGDHEGGQRTITRFYLRPRENECEEPWLWTCSTSRHWNLDRPDPR
jgi:hypothetical protein